MTATAYLRHPVLLLAAVTVAISLVWYALGFPVQMPPSSLGAGDKLPCLSYEPVSPANTDDDVATIPLAQIEADIALLAPYASCVRTYLTGKGLDAVPAIARRHGMTVLQGIFLGRDAENNRAEIDRALALADSQRPAIRAIVAGSESLSRAELRSSDIGAVVRRLRDETKLPVTYADRWETWLYADGLAPLVDFITIHVDLYRADFPVSASDAARYMTEARAAIASKFGAKAVLIGEVGWPSAGRMRETALPSPSAQARVMHDLLAAAKNGNIQINIREGIDQPWRLRREGTVGAHWGIIDGDTRAMKFRWGGAVSDHPLWFIQGLTGVMLALVVFAAGYVAARSYGTKGPSEADWRPVALIALSGGMFVGWAVADIPIQSQSIVDWVYAASLTALAFAIPPVAAAAVVRKTPFEGFATVLNTAKRHSVQPLMQALTVLFVLLILVAISLALGLVFDPAYRDFLFAPLTGPAVALLTVTYSNPRGSRSEGIAEPAAAIVLTASALFIVFNETFWNWQALWFAAALLAISLACWRVRSAQTP